MTRRDLQTRAKLLAVMMALIVAGCSGITGESDAGPVPTLGSSAPGAAEGSEDPDATGEPAADDEVASAGESGVDNEASSWSGADLPVAITHVRGSGGRMAYETAVDGRSVMLVLDATTGEELARFDSDPGGRVAGVLSTPLIKDDLLFVVGPLSSLGTSEVLAVDLRTLETAWQAVLRWPLPPRACGDHVCLTGGDGTLSRFDVATGELQDRVIFSDSRVVGTGPTGFETRPLSEGSAFVGLSAHDDYGFGEVWTVAAEALEAAAGQPVAANGGWNSSYDDASGTLAQYLGPVWPLEPTASEQASFADRPLGAWFGLDIDTGEIRWAISDAGTCTSLKRSGYVAVCPRSASLGDFEDPDFQTDRVEVVEIATGDVAWRYGFDQPVPLWEVDVSAVDGNLAVDVGGERVVLEPFSGLDDEDEDKAQVVFSCEVAPYSFAELDDLSPPRRHTEYRVPERRAPCLADGTLLTPEEALEQFGELPSDVATDVGNGWAVWVDVDGRPHGIRTNDG